MLMAGRKAVQMIRRMLLLKFVSWVVLSPVLALAPTLRFSGVPHPSHPLRTCRLGLHVGAQDGVDVGPVALPAFLSHSTTSWSPGWSGGL